jgi:hypothetical protein
MLYGYYKRVLYNEKSKLCRILGLYQFDHMNTNIIILENIIPNKRDALLFDLKGSTYQRTTINVAEDARKGITLKDMDLKLLNVQLFLDDIAAFELYNEIRKDVEYLNSVGVMDYSILLGIYDSYDRAFSRYTTFSKVNQVYNIGIIDFMQDYDIKKKAEREMKKIVSDEEISSIQPDDYAKRFLDFVTNSLLRIN